MKAVRAVRLVEYPSIHNRSKWILMMYHATHKNNFIKITISSDHDALVEMDSRYIGVSSVSGC